ncbi:hypothetical protein CEXT_167101 [Caerostris extrusa]|uniref:Uncharacterized protein n=1 Tax=Caerostris extrusa TaxID=172846 RepID=A0AAV4XAY3_CAEEX|nr:hypothetical protein CEXT_167101 [Caerostris extrusa]
MYITRLSSPIISVEVRCSLTRGRVVDEGEQKQGSLSSIPHLSGHPGGTRAVPLLLLPGCGKSFGRWPSSARISLLSTGKA